MNNITKQDRVEAATSIFNSLISDRLADKYKAAEIAKNQSDSFDIPTLRTLVIKAVEDDFYAGREEEEEDWSIARTRSWLLGVLARISANDEEATKVAIKHVDAAVEPYNWARYWSLEGLITGKNSAAGEVAKATASTDEDSMVSMLATAFLASRNDKKALSRIRKNLTNEQTQWYVVRALRDVPIHSTVEAICKIVEKADYSDVTYDAIMALGAIPSDWTHSTIASQSLSGCITKFRGAPWKDGMRTGAIAGLGNLQVESSGPLLIEELADDNPAIVRSAARAMEKILGLSTCVDRIVEATSKSELSLTDAYGRALRWLDREAVAEELEALMLSGSAKQQGAARALLSELGGAVAFEKLRARTDVMKQYSQILEKAEDKIRQLFENSVKEAQSGFHIAVIMDVTVFAVGIILILGSAGYTLFATGDLATWAGVGLTGGIGVLGVIYGVLIANPRRQVRESVDHLMRVKMLFLAYLRRLHQADQAYSRRLLDDEPITFEQVKGFSDAIGDIMRDTVQHDLSKTEPKPSTLESAEVETDGRG